MTRDEGPGGALCAHCLSHGRQISPRVCVAFIQEQQAFEKLAHESEAREANLRAVAEQLAEALDEICFGKRLCDQDNYAIMAARLVGIAKAARDKARQAGVIK